MNYADKYFQKNDNKDDFLSRFIEDRGLTQKKQDDAQPKVIEGEAPKRGVFSQMTTNLMGGFAGAVGKGLGDSIFSDKE
jgi:hypothetical protein